MTLLAPSGRVALLPTLEEHQALMDQLPTTLSQPYRSMICRLLCHLEVLDPPQRWSMLATNGQPQPAALGDVVNEAITQYKLQRGTRAAINHAFNLNLRGPSGR